MQAMTGLGRCTDIGLLDRFELPVSCLTVWGGTAETLLKNRARDHFWKYNVGQNATGCGAGD
jgi:hypothetical protein